MKLTYIIESAKHDSIPPRESKLYDFEKGLQIVVEDESISGYEIDYAEAEETLLKIYSDMLDYYEGQKQRIADMYSSRLPSFKIIKIEPTVISI